MTVLMYRYGNICEPDIIRTLQEFQINVVEICDEMADKSLTASRRVELVNEGLKQHHPLFVFSINFFPAIAEICHIYQVPYYCWTVDCPVPELFSKAIQHKTNRIFMFDRAQYEAFQGFNPECIFYLPLAAATERFDSVLSEVEKKHKNAFDYDISFVGSLYSEKNRWKHIGLPEYEKGYLDGVVEAALQVYGYNFIEEVLSERCVEAIKNSAPGFYSAEDSLVCPDRYVAAHSYIGFHLAELERVGTLNLLAEYFPVDLFTNSDTSVMNKVRCHGKVQTLTEMPVIFRRSRINLNMTIKPIQTGLPLRIFDIMGCGGFCMTNYQAEISDFFEIGREIETYASMEELLDKCEYYLEHEEERIRIAQNGYQKVKENHGYSKRLIEMLRVTTLLS